MRTMEHRPTIPYARSSPPPEWREAGWRALGSAFTASFVLHALAAMAVAAIVARPVTTRSGDAGQVPIVALLVGVPRADAADVPAPAVSAIVPSRTAPRATPPPPARPPAPSVAPWSATPVEVELPASLLSRPMTSEGVDLVEMRNLGALGEKIERRILQGYESEPKDPVRLKPPETIGYPLDALAAGVEGTVLVWFGVDEEGKVIEKEALDGPPELMAWVLERVDRLVDTPARIGIEPVRAWVALEVHFTRAVADEAVARSVAAEAAAAVPPATAKP